MNSARATAQHVVGTSRYQDNLIMLADEYDDLDGSYVTCQMDMVLLAETDNPYDTTAITVWVDRLQVGSLPAADAARLHRQFLGTGPVSTLGTIQGKRKHNLGVWLADVRALAFEDDAWYRGPGPSAARR